MEALEEFCGISVRCKIFICLYIHSLCLHEEYTVRGTIANACSSQLATDFLLDVARSIYACMLMVEQNIYCD